MAELSNDDFLALMERVEDQGGVHRPGPHMPTMFRLPMPGSAGRTKVKIHTSGCGNETVFLIPYVTESGETSTLEACGVCDNIGDWPRFREKAPA